MLPGAYQETLGVTKAAPGNGIIYSRSHRPPPSSRAFTLSPVRLSNVKPHCISSEVRNYLRFVYIVGRMLCQMLLISLAGLHLHLPAMTISSDKVLQHLGQVIGNSLHREDCIWVGDSRKRCRNAVPKSSRVEGASCLQALQDLSLNYSTTQKLVLVGKFLLCSKCRRHRCRPRQWAESLINTLGMQADQADNVAALNPENHAGALQREQWHSKRPFGIDTSTWL